MPCGISLLPRIGPRVSGNESLLRCKPAILPIYSEPMQETAPPMASDVPYICGYDSRGGDISVARQQTVNGPPKGVSDKLVGSSTPINAIVGTRKSSQPSFTAQIAQLRLKTHKAPIISRWYTRCY